MNYRLLVKFNKDFIDVDDDAQTIEIGIRSKPIKGRANQEIIKKLAEYFNVSSSAVRIVAGLRSKDKIVEIDK
jgi:uncharacterized protein (TIGR00251 family)